MNEPVLTRDVLSPHHRRRYVAVFWRSWQEIMVRPGPFLRTLDGLPFAKAWRLFQGVDGLQPPALLPVFSRWP